MNRHSLIFGAVAAAAAPAVARAAGVPLSVLTTPNESAMEPYFAQELGLFSAAGLDVTVTSVPNGGAVVGAVVSNSVQIGNSSVPSVAEAHIKGIPVVATAPGALYSAKSPSAILFVPKTSSVGSAAQLDGKTIAVNNLRGLPQYGTQDWLDAHGGNSRTVNFVEMAGAVIVNALQDGRIDAGLLVEPFITPGRAVGKPLGAVFDALGTPFLINVHLATAAWAQANDAVVARFLKCIEQAADWANQNPEKSAVIVAKYTRLTAQTLKTMNRATYADSLTPGMLQPVIDLTAKYGRAERFAAADLIYHARA